MNGRNPTDDLTSLAAAPDGGATMAQPTEDRTLAGPPASEAADPNVTLRQESLSALLAAERSAGGEPAATGSRYRILSLHARGGLGVVYVAEDTELRRRVALKEIQIRHSHDVRSRQRFVLEAEITGRLAHPAVVPVHGLGQHDDGRPFYAMRFVEGETLLDAAQRFHRGEPADRSERRLALRQLLKHFVNVCNAVAYAHSQGVIHRDLKPSNVLLGKFGETLLVDWGLAKYMGVCQSEPTALSNDTAKGETSAPLSSDWTLPADVATQMGSAIGTPAYMSPEQAAGRWSDVGIASDVYSLGATLYVLLAGTPPLPKRSDSGEWFSGPYGGIPSPQCRNADAPPPLVAICHKAMQSDPTHRYASALELAADVEHWLGDEPVSAMPERLWTKAGRWARRHLALVSSVSAAVLVLGASLAVGIGLLANKNRQITDANEQLSLANVQLTDANAQIRAANRLTLKAVDDFFTDVSENPRLLRKEPGTQALRKALLERARDYYEGYLRDRGVDAEIQAETGSAYFRLAVIQELLEPGPKALESYRKAESLQAVLSAAAPQDAQRAFELAVSRNHIGKLLQNMGKSSDALAAFAAARDALQRIASLQVDQPKYTKELARVLNNIGVIQHITGQGSEALATVSQSRALMDDLVRRHPDAAEIVKEQAGTLGILGALQRLGAKPAEAVETLTAAEKILDTLIRGHPDRTEFAQELAQTANLLAIALTESNRRPDALAAYERSRSARIKLVNENPGVAEYVQELAVSHNNIATLLRVLGRTAEAVESCRNALALQTKLAAEHPDILEYSQDLARTRNNLGILYGDQFRRDEALAEYRDAKTIQERLVQVQPQNAELKLELAKCCFNLGRLHGELGQFDDAKSSYEQARTIRAAIPGRHAEVADTLLALANVAREQSRFPDALRDAEQALSLIDKLQPNAFKMLQRSALHSRALTLSQAGQHIDSLMAWDRAIEFADANSTTILQLGRAAAQLRSGDARGIEVAKSAAAEATASAIVVYEAARVFALSKDPALNMVAMDLLKRAADADWFRDPARVAALKRDTDFASIRERPEFSEWIKNLPPK